MYQTDVTTDETGKMTDAEAKESGEMEGMEGTARTAEGQMMDGTTTLTGRTEETLPEQRIAEA